MTENFELPKTQVNGPFLERRGSKPEYLEKTQTTSLQIGITYKRLWYYSALLLFNDIIWPPKTAPPPLMLEKLPGNVPEVRAAFPQ